MKSNLSQGPKRKIAEDEYGKSAHERLKQTGRINDSRLGIDLGNAGNPERYGQLRQTGNEQQHTARLPVWGEQHNVRAVNHV